MFSRDIPLYGLDLTGKNPDNLVTREYYRRTDPSSQKGFVLRHGPFYTESLVLTKPNEELMVEGEHYEIFGIATALTAFVQDKEVAMLIVLKDETITEWFASYQVVGHFGVINRDLINMVEGALEDDRPVYYRNIKNKPLWFPPELHQHDIRYEIHSFQDIIELIKRITDVKAVMPNRNKVSIDHFNSVILSHITDYERMLLDYIEKHDSDDTPPFTNSHGLTAKQMGLENVDNFKTASLIDVLNGYRTDLHVTVDYVKQALDTVSKDTDSLVKLGTIPVLRYGSNSFIPVPIQGSFEGMGGNDFNLGCNVETNGDSLILMNRNDGRVNGLYFMENKVKDAPVDKWRFTTHRYVHQTALADGVELTKILRGSNGRFLVVGGYNASRQLIWYYSLGNGTFNPLKHILIRFPDAIQAKLTTATVVCTEAFPSRIILTQTIDQLTALNDPTLKTFAYSVPDEQPTYDGVDIAGGLVIGQRMWELDLSTHTWRNIIFNYQQAFDNNKVTSYAWIPYRYVIQVVSADNPRADGAAHKYGLKRAEYEFSKMISGWRPRAWTDVNYVRYDESTDRLLMKYVYTPYGIDDRPTLFEGGYNSIGFILKNRTINGGSVYYDVENRKALAKPSYWDTTVGGTALNTPGVVTGAADHAEWEIRGWSGSATYMWLSHGKMLQAGTGSYGTFPMKIIFADFNGLPSFENLDYFIDGSLSSNLSGASINFTSYTYNETNPVGLTIGAHSTFWLQLKQGDIDTFGSVSYSNLTNNITDGLWFRRQPALGSDGYPIAPNKSYSLYFGNDSSNSTLTYGYPLDNTVYPITNGPGEVFCTAVFQNSADNRKAEYVKNMIAHTAFTGSMKGGNYSANSTTASYLFRAEWEIKNDNNVYTFVETKTYNLEDQIKNTLLPKIKAETKVENANFNHALAGHRIGFTNLRSSKYDKFLIFTVPVLNAENGYLYTHAVAFNLTGGTADGNGIIQGATVTPVGAVFSVLNIQVRSDDLVKLTDNDPTIWRYVSTVYTQPRDMVMQLANGSSVVVMQIPTSYYVKGNRHEAGVACLVNESGITKMIEKSVYYTASTYNFFHHPLYGIVQRAYGTGPSEVGYRVSDMSELSFALNYSNLVMGNSNYLEAAFTVYINTDQDALLNGREYTIKSKTIDLRTVTPNPANRIFYLYIDYGNDGPYYHASLTSLVESPSRALISIVKTNTDSIYEIENFNVFTMNGCRISTTRHGSVIPAATGSIEEDGQVNGWVSK